ncbi:MAG: UDP-N-acetylmuramoyl-tripeptide--D-alanyl-D-alanine ligase [Oscillospiraceae bacterium]|nr:UDP-N-acetylmuramoyl-tripeptide--D-alanyl-D-alanine ligase [Oscillospiraceae bacterium]
MEHLTPWKIAEITNGKYVGSETARNGRVSGAARDNREVKPGNIFVCIKGEHNDGHLFANEAFDAGAVCCLAEKPPAGAKGPYILVESTLSAVKELGAYYRSLFSIPVIGVTGSVGKTSTKEMTAAALGARLNVLKTPANFNNELGVPLTLLALEETHEAAVIEMGISDFGEMGRLAAMARPGICITTNIGYSHLKELGDLKGVLRAKSEVFAYMKPEDCAILNGDDINLRGFDPGIRKITYGLEPGNDYLARNVRSKGTAAVICEIAHGAGSFEANIPAFGSHLAYAALAAAAAAQLLGLTDEEIARGILDYVPAEGRANVIDTGFVTLIDDSYNANPDSMRAALLSLSMLQGRRVAILGDMLNLGKESGELHRDVGRLAFECGIDVLLCCGEEAALIAEGYEAAQGATQGDGSLVLSWDNTREPSPCVAALPSILQKGDNVLVKASHSMKFDEIASAIREQDRGTVLLS